MTYTTSLSKLYSLNENIYETYIVPFPMKYWGVFEKHPVLQIEVQHEKYYLEGGGISLRRKMLSIGRHFGGTNFFLTKMNTSQ